MVARAPPWIERWRLVQAQAAVHCEQLPDNEAHTDGVMVQYR